MSKSIFVIVFNLILTTLGIGFMLNVGIKIILKDSSFNVKKLFANPYYYLIVLIMIVMRNVFNLSHFITAPVNIFLVYLVLKLYNRIQIKDGQKTLKL